MTRIPLLAAGLVAILVQPALAEAPVVLADFSAKRVTVPKPGTKKRITVQIAPRANPAVPPRPDKPAPTPEAQAVAPAAPGGREQGVGRYAWFWNAVSPKLDSTGPGRLEPALISLKNAPQVQAVSAPRLQHLQDIAAAHGLEILRSTVGTRVSPALALAVMSVESGGRADAVSSAGAQGLMQLMPATAERFGVSNSLDPAQNIKGGVTFLERAPGDVDRGTFGAERAGDALARAAAGTGDERDPVLRAPVHRTSRCAALTRLDPTMSRWISLVPS